MISDSIGLQDNKLLTQHPPHLSTRIQDGLYIIEGPFKFVTGTVCNSGLHTALEYIAALPVKN